MDDQQIPLFERVVDKNPPQMETNTALNQWIFLHPRQDYQSTKTVLLMPGSRESEVKRLLPELLAAVVIIKKQDSQLNFHIALANDELLEWAKVLADKVNVPISIGDAHQQATRSDLVLVASGTAALDQLWH
jgi:lipid-A-disaccharide synthase